MMELIDYCITYSDDIFVRYCKDGKWGSFSLSEIPFKAAMEIILKWHMEGREPARRLPVSQVE